MTGLQLSVCVELVEWSWLSDVSIRLRVEVIPLIKSDLTLMLDFCTS